VRNRSKGPQARRGRSSRSAYFHAATGYAVLAPGLQAGPGALALRFSWPVTGGAHWPRETALTFTIRLPLLLGGEGRRREPQ
jgi:hypothetical protein